MENPHSILKKVFGYDSFRPGQEEIVSRLLAAHFRWSLPKADRFGPVQPQELSENDENTQEI